MNSPVIWTRANISAAFVLDTFALAITVIFHKQLRTGKKDGIYDLKSKGTGKLYA